MKKNLILAMLLAAALSVCTGCSGKSSTTTVIDENNGNDSDSLSIIDGDQEEHAPKLDIGNGHINENLDVTSIAKNAADNMLSRGYDLEGITLDPPDEKNSFFNIIIVANTTQDDATYIKWGEETIACLNEEAVKLDPEYLPAKEGYYGGLFDQYEILLTVTSSEDVFDNWAIYQTIEAQTHVPVKITNTKFDLGMMN